MSQTLGYDALNRLTSASSGTGGYGTLAWGYDHNGNLTSRTAGGTSYTYSYTSGTNQLAGVTWPSNSETFGYTANGNISSMTLNGTAAFTGTYNLGNRLTAVANTPTALSSIVYDGYGLRYSKTDSGGSPITFVYDLQGQLIEENNGGTVKDYIYRDGKLAGIYLPASNTLYYVAGDVLGSPLYVTNSSQATVWSTSYQPYGTTGTITGSITQNVRLPGQYYDSETTLNYNGFRDYVPNWGRYLESDPIGLAGGLNTFAYVRGNPMGRTDRLGLAEGFGFGSLYVPLRQLPLNSNAGIDFTPLYYFDSQNPSNNGWGMIVADGVDVGGFFSAFKGQETLGGKKQCIRFYELDPHNIPWLGEYIPGFVPGLGYYTTPDQYGLFAGWGGDLSAGVGFPISGIWSNITNSTLNTQFTNWLIQSKYNNWLNWFN